MQTEILKNLQKPVELEKLYRADKAAFKQAFNLLYPTLSQKPLTDFWNTRLNYKTAKTEFSLIQIVPLLLSVLLAGGLAQIPFFFHLDEEMFYQRNAGFIVFPFFMAYFFLKNKTPVSKLWPPVLVLLVGLLFINLLPKSDTSDTLILSTLHLIPVLWFLWLSGFKKVKESNTTARMRFIGFNGDVLIMGVLLGMAGVALTGITFGLFELIGVNIEEFYIRYVLPFGLPAVPMFAVFLADTQPYLVSKVAPVLAKIFSPLVLLMLSIYLFTLLFFVEEPFADRDFLLMFNALLIGVMALIFFSVVHRPKEEYAKFYSYVVLALALVTMAVNGLALAAILSRIVEAGITPNRLAVTGSNVLMLIHLILITRNLLPWHKSVDGIGKTAQSLSGFLPVYFIWVLIVVFVFPFLFGFQ